MEENLHKDNLEEFFKNAVNKAGDDPADDGWDVPSEQVWENINTSINPPANPSSFFNWKWLGALLLGVVLVGMLYYNYSLNRKIDHLTETVEQNKTQIEELKTTEEVPNLTDQTVPAQRSKPAENQALSNTSENPGIENQESIFEDEKTDSGSIAHEDKDLSKNKKTNEFSIIGKPQSGIDIMSSTNDQKKVDQDKNLQPASTNQPDVTKTDNQNKDSTSANSNSLNSTSTDLQQLDDNIEKEDLAISDETNTGITDVPGDVETKVDSTNIVDPVVSKTDSSLVAEDQPIAAKTTGDEAKPAKIDNQEGISEDSLAVEEVPQNTAFEELPAETGFKKGFYIGAHVAPTFSYRNIKLTGNNPLLRKLLDQQETGDYSYSFGVKTGYRFSKNWSVETGLNYSKATIMSRHRKQIQYRQEIETQTTDGFNSDYNLTLNTSYGEIDTDIAITRASDTSIPQNDFIGLRINTKQDLSFVRIPVVIKYKTAGSKKLHFSAKAGIVNSFIVQRDVQIRAVQLDRSGVVVRRKMVQRQFSGLEKSSIDVLFGIGLEYDISKKLGIYFEPSITRSIGPVFQKGPIKTYPVISTLDIGLSYKF